MRKLCWLVLLLGFCCTPFLCAEDEVDPMATPAPTEVTETNAQEGATYSDTQGWVETSSVGLNAATDYLESEYQKGQEAQEAEEELVEEVKEEKAKQASEADETFQKPRVLVSG